MKGGGKLEPYAVRVFKELKADAVILIVAGGTLGSGFSACADDPEKLRVLSRVLKEMTAQIDADLK